MRKLALWLLVLCAALFAVPCWAEVEIADFDGLKTKFGSNPININDDVKLSATLTINEDVTINGNGYKLTGSGNGSVIKINKGDVTINDLTITGGRATSSGNQNGGAINAEGGKLTVTNCRFEDNEAKGDGGAIHCNSVNAIIDRCTFIGNKATGDIGRGGGAYILPNGNAVITNCTFVNNEAKSGGGLRILYYAGVEKVNYCTFAGNTATNGEAIYYSPNSSEKLTVTNSIIHGSVANVTPDNCLTTSDNPATLPGKLQSVNVDVKVGTGKVTHTVFRKYSELSGAIDKGNDTTVKVDQLGNDVTDKHDIGAVEIAEESDNINRNDPNITGVELSITADKNAVTMKPGENMELKLTATVTATYKDGTTKSAPAEIKTWWRGDGAWPDWMKIQSSFNNPNTVVLNPGSDTGGTTMTCHVAAETESYNGHTDWTECEFKVTVEAPETFKPKNLFFEKSSVEMTVEPGNVVEDSCKVRLQLYGSKGTIKESTDGYTLVCRKANDSGASWVTASVDGWKITFRAAPPADWHWSDTTVFVISAMDKDGKQQLQTSYKVVSYVSNVKGYQLTVAPTEVTVLAGKKDSVDLRKSVKFEKVYENGKRVLLDGAKLTFSTRTGGRITPWMNLNSSGVVTINPGANVETGEYYCDYQAAADDSGNTGTDKGTLIVNIVNEGAPTITNETLPDAEVGQTYSAQLYATGLKPISWDISGALPEGLTLNNETGQLSGTPTQVKDFTLDVKAENSAGSDHRVFNLKVRDQKPSGWCWTKSKKVIKSGATGKWHVIFHVKNGTNVDYYNKSTTRDNLDKDHLKKVTKTKGVKAGEGNIKFDLLWPKTNDKWEEYTYNFKVQAGNNAGSSTYTKSFTAAKTTGKLSAAETASVTAAASDADAVIIEENDGVETFEENTGTDGSAFDEGVRYCHNGSVDEDGNITAVIDGYGGTDYTFKDLAALLASGKVDKVVALEFRGAGLPDSRKLTASDLAALKNLADLSIDNCDLTELNLSGMTGLMLLSLYGCEKLASLNVSGCSSLVFLAADRCADLKTLNVEGCAALENVSVTDAAIEKLDLSSRAELTDIDVSGCRLLLTLNVTGCPALEIVRASNSAIQKLDLSGGDGQDDLVPATAQGCARLSSATGLKSLFLSGTSCLSELKLPENAELEHFEISGSGIGTLDLSGMNFTALDFSGCSALSELNLKDCAALSELNLSGCESLLTLNIEGCAALERFIANGCRYLAALTLDSGKLKELELAGTDTLETLNCADNALGHLDLDGWHSGKLVEGTDCSPQFLGTASADVKASFSAHITASLGSTVDLRDYAGDGVCRVSDVQGFTSDGTPIAADWDNRTGIAKFASAPAEISYVYATNLPGVKMQVTVTDSSHGGGSSNSAPGGGCDVGFGFMALAFVLPWVTAKKC